MWVNLQREQTQRIKAFGIDNRHVVGGADGLAGKVGTRAPADVQRTAFDDIHDRRQQPALTTLFQQLEGIPAADNHQLGVFNGCNWIGNGMNTGNVNAHWRKDGCRFRRVLIPGLRHAGERNKHCRTATIQLLCDQRQRMFHPAFARQRRVTQ